MKKPKKPPMLPEPMSKEQLEEMWFDNATSMVKIGQIFGCGLWLDLSSRHFKEDKVRMFHLAKKTLEKAFGMPSEKE